MKVIIGREASRPDARPVASVTMKLVDDPTAALAGLPIEDGGLTGMDAVGWLDSTWVLHDFELEVAREPASDLVWERRRWADVASEPISPRLQSSTRPPSSWLLPRELGGTTTEGSMQGESVRGLLEVLAGVTRATDTCYAFYAQMTTWDFDSLALYEMSWDVPHVFGSVNLPSSSPSNLWPADKSWFVWTDYDLCATKVSGSPELITAVRTHALLETVEWPRD
ncbi:hypothetical protein [Promicromonospora sp. MEB111]|uniref:hypothetical protein n=1 Tax=Promicromonospora sp. MEB111 TaxID=3040301 RepID=UPI00254FB726|nr:hypothetical protein [Promicromonospora sp. MEB111]